MKNINIAPVLTLLTDDITPCEMAEVMDNAMFNLSVMAIKEPDSMVGENVSNDIYCIRQLRNRLMEAGK